MHNFYNMLKLLVLVMTISLFSPFKARAFDYSEYKERMIKEQIIARGVNDSEVISRFQSTN